MGRPSNANVGAYGLRVRGLESARELLVPADPAWPPVLVERTQLDAEPDPARDDDWATVRFTERGADIELAGGLRVALARAEGRATFASTRPVRDHELIHPYLGAVAAVFARWHGRECFHAGSFIAADGVWALLADRGGGKSSLLASLDRRGVPIVADDILVLEQGRVFTGPRSIDLREEPARRLDVGEALGVVGVRERWRLRVGPAPSGRPLRGWILLEWGNAIELRSLSAAERVTRIASQLAIAKAPADPGVLLDLAALPAFELRRPQSWDSLAAASERVLEIAS